MYIGVEMIPLRFGKTTPKRVQCRTKNIDIFCKEHLLHPIPLLWDGIDILLSVGYGCFRKSAKALS